MMMELRTTRGEGWELAWRAGAGGGAPVRYYAGFAEQLGRPRQTVEPATAAARLVIVWGDVMTVASGPGPPQPVQSFVAGPRARPVTVGQRGSFRGVEIGLSAAAAASVTGISLGELGDAIVPLDAMIGRRAAELKDRLASATGWDDAFRIARSYIRQADGPETDPRLRRAWETIERAAGQVRIESVAEESGWSRRHLAARFRREFGVTPKVAARLFRFGRAARLLQAGLPPTQVAVACGYFDQSHMHLDFAEFGARTPGQAASRHDADSLASSWPPDAG
jgi:AraC-like DNA-binding protein